MLKRLALVLVLLALMPGAAWGHGGHGPVSHRQLMTAGPYVLSVEYTEWPARALRSNPIIVVPEGGIEGKSARFRPIFAGVERQPYFEPLGTYPGVQGAWVTEEWVYPNAGEWSLEIEVEGPQGKAVGRTEPITVGPPPGFPLWLAWLIGLTPLWGLIWFIVREVKRTSHLT